MMSKGLNQVEANFKWIEGNNNPHRSFEYGELLVSTSDSVLIRNYDMGANCDDSLDHCLIATIDEFYDTSEGGEECHRAIVNWYTRPSEFKQKRYQNKLASLRDEHAVEFPANCSEIIADLRKYDRDIDAETIFSKCKIIAIPFDATKQEISSKVHSSNGIPVFFVRWAFDGKDFKAMTVVKEEEFQKSPRTRIQSVFHPSEVKSEPLGNTPRTRRKRATVGSMDAKAIDDTNEDELRKSLRKRIQSAAGPSAVKSETLGSPPESTKKRMVTGDKLFNAIDIATICSPQVKLEQLGNSPEAVGKKLVVTPIIILKRGAVGLQACKKKSVRFSENELVEKTEAKKERSERKKRSANLSQNEDIKSPKQIRNEEESDYESGKPCKESVRRALWATKTEETSEESESGHLEGSRYLTVEITPLETPTRKCNGSPTVLSSQKKGIKVKEDVDRLKFQRGRRQVLNEAIASESDDSVFSTEEEQKPAVKKTTVRSKSPKRANRLVSSSPKTSKQLSNEPRSKDSRASSQRRTRSQVISSDSDEDHNSDFVNEVTTRSKSKKRTPSSRRTSESDDDHSNDFVDDVKTRSKSKKPTPSSHRKVTAKSSTKKSKSGSTPRSSRKTNNFTPVLPKKNNVRLGSVSGAERRSRRNDASDSEDIDNPLRNTVSLEEIRSRLLTSAVPDELPCREEEFATIYSFIEGKIIDGSGGCLYISGVPGTGKTATVQEVIRSLERSSEAGDIPSFRCVAINGMKLTEPHQAYVHIYKELTGEKVTAVHAAQLLENRFKTSGARRETAILLVDELDLLCNRRQDVLYNLLDWPSKSCSRLVVLAIANTMDLPERMMKNRVASRMGLNRITFQPYTVSQLREILWARINAADCSSSKGVVNPDAVEFVARKVAALSGDARRALDICRRATEIAAGKEAVLPNDPPTRGGGEAVGMKEVTAAVHEMFSSPMIDSIRYCSNQEKTFLRAVVAEFQRVGIEESTFHDVYKQHVLLCRVEGLLVPNTSQMSFLCNRLSSCGLLLMENGSKDQKRRIRLNLSTDDVTFAVQQPEIVSC